MIIIMKLNSSGFWTKLLRVAGKCVHKDVHERQVERDNVGYEDVHVSSSLILQHQVCVQPTCLTTEEESPRGMFSVTVCSIFAMATPCPALVIYWPWSKLSIEGK